MEWSHVQPFINGLLSFIAALVSGYAAMKVKTVYMIVNSRMDAYLRVHAEVSKEEGRKAGRAEVLDEIALKAKTDAGLGVVPSVVKPEVPDGH